MPELSDYDNMLSGFGSVPKPPPECRISKPDKQDTRYVVFQAEYRIDYVGDNPVLIDFSDCTDFEPVTDDYGNTKLFIFNGTIASITTDAAEWVKQAKAKDANLGLENKLYQVVVIGI